MNLPERDCPDYPFDTGKGDKNGKKRQDIKNINRLSDIQQSIEESFQRVTHQIARHLIHHPAFLGNEAKYQGIPIEMISESLGHKSIKTTQTYLKGFGLEKRTEANKLNCFT